MQIHKSNFKKKNNCIIPLLKVKQTNEDYRFKNKVHEAWALYLVKKCQVKDQRSDSYNQKWDISNSKERIILTYSTAKF